MNNIFVKNLAALSSKNKELTYRLQTYIPKEIPQIVQENGTYNLLYKEKLIHNKINPLGEAAEIFKKAENTPVSIHVIYGLGLGYLFQFTSLHSKGTVILYEPDLNILWLAFTLVDFSNDILKNNVFITSTYEELTEEIYKKSGMKNSPTLLSLPSLREYDNNQFNELVKNLQNTVGSFSLDLKFTQQKFYPSLKMLISNIPNLFKEIPLIKFKDAYSGKTAVIVSAGPTLDRNIETLKKYRDKYILFTVGTAAKTLYANNLKPDFICIIETYNSSKQIEGLDLKDVNFITEPYANPNLRKFSFKNIYSHISSNNPINQFWGEICKEEIDEYASKGTVSYTALNSARILGCSKIILVGQDLAYIEGQCYSKDSAYKDLVCQFNNERQKWEITAKDFEKFSQAISPSTNPTIRNQVAKRRIDNLNASLHYVKGINGDLIPTESVYATFVKPLEEYTLIHSDRIYINTSLVGAQIDGFENLSLEDALKDSPDIENIDIKSDFEYDKASIIKNLTNNVNELKSFINVINEGKKLTKNLNNDLKRYRTANSEILKTLKKISLNYVDISINLAEKSKLLSFIITADKINIDYEMKMLENFTYDNIVNLNNKLVAFYEKTEKQILEIEGLVNESINTKS